MTDTQHGANHVADALREQVRRMRGRNQHAARSRDHPNGSAGGIDTGPSSTYEVVTRQMVTGLAEDLREIKSRLNTLIFALLGGILLDVLGRVINL